MYSNMEYLPSTASKENDFVPIVLDNIPNGNSNNDTTQKYNDYMNLINEIDEIGDLSKNVYCNVEDNSSNTYNENSNDIDAIVENRFNELFIENNIQYTRYAENEYVEENEYTVNKEETAKAVNSIIGEGSNERHNFQEKSADNFFHVTENDLDNTEENNGRSVDVCTNSIDSDIDAIVAKRLNKYYIENKFPHVSSAEQEYVEENAYTVIHEDEKLKAVNSIIPEGSIESHNLQEKSAVVFYHVTENGFHNTEENNGRSVDICSNSNETDIDGTVEMRFNEIVNGNNIQSDPSAELEYVQENADMVLYTEEATSIAVNSIIEEGSKNHNFQEKSADGDFVHKIEIDIDKITENNDRTVDACAIETTAALADSLSNIEAPTTHNLKNILAQRHKIEVELKRNSSGIEIDIKLDERKADNLDEVLVFKNNLSNEKDNKDDNTDEKAKAVRPHLCHLCKNQFADLDDLNRHYKEDHKPLKTTTYTCDICQFTTHNSNSLRRHARRHREDLYSCHLCIYTCSSNELLQKHYFDHTGEKPHICYKCESRFSSANYLARHLKSFCPKVPFRCAFCTMKFMSTIELNAHLPVHERLFPYQCHVCGKKFKTKYNFSRHLKRHSVDS